MMARPTRRWFCFGNLMIATILACADLAIPLKSLWLDIPVAGVTLVLWVSGVGIVFRQPWALPWLRLSALILLLFGLLAFSALALSAAFLFGVHGNFLRDGVELLVVGFGLVIPYALAYPLLVLSNVKRITSGHSQ